MTHKSRKQNLASSEAGIKHTLVLAGNYQQALYHYGKEINSGEYRYIYSPEMLLGLHNLRVLKVGTYYERNDLEEIEAILKSRPNIEYVNRRKHNDTQATKA